MSASEHGLQVVEGTRYQDANNVLAAFASESQEVSVMNELMAGFVIVAWDDHGTFTSSLHVGKNTPMPTAMIPELVKEQVMFDLHATKGS